MQQAGLRVKMNMVPMRSSNHEQILPMLDYCLERDIELRYIELMNMGHLRASNQYQVDFIGMDEILEMIDRHYEFTRTDAPYDSTAVRYEIPGKAASASSPTRANPSAARVPDCGCRRTACSMVACPTAARTT